ncbi:TetR/AcrR family transcriptional regulator [Nocardia flavorosea]|uniref:TetR/AcrR family transcriptional regulator n=2 Tax=Nocardia flavorosea TaxID=53429 RepID=A0A846Y869_9NOCA|nr:TetR/AcrR family transcriptional regulator [Nocardia flavorosea]
MGVALVTAAWQVLERSGYRSLKIRQILDASRCSAGVFYRRFPSKAHLMLALMRTQSEHAVRTVAEQLSGTDDPCEQLTDWLRFHIEVLYDRRRRSRALMFADTDFLAALPDAPREHSVRPTRRCRPTGRAVRRLRYSRPGRWRGRDISTRPRPRLRPTGNRADRPLRSNASADTISCFPVTPLHAGGIRRLRQPQVSRPFQNPAMRDRAAHHSSNAERKESP